MASYFNFQCEPPKVQKNLASIEKDFRQIGKYIGNLNGPYYSMVTNGWHSPKGVTAANKMAKSLNSAFTELEKKCKRHYDTTNDMVAQFCQSEGVPYTRNTLTTGVFSNNSIDIMDVPGNDETIILEDQIVRDSTIEFNKIKTQILNIIDGITSGCLASQSSFGLTTKESNLDMQAKLLQSFKNTRTTIDEAFTQFGKELDDNWDSDKSAQSSQISSAASALQS